MFDSALGRLGRSRKPAVLGWSLLWMVVTGWLDYRAGLKMSLFALDWPAVCSVTWVCGAPWGYAFGGLSVASTALTDLIAHKVWVHPVYLYGEISTRLFSFFAFVWALSRLRAAHDRDETMRRESEAATALKSDLMSLMSHEINNALAVLKMTVFLMQEDEPEPPPRRKQGYEIFGRVLLNMELTARNFLNNARIEAGRLSLNMDTVDLGRRIEETIAIFAPILEQRSLTVIVDAAPKFPKVMGDRAALALILSNLIGNAVKYTPGKGRIVIKLERSKSQASSARFSISDTGIGISAEDKGKIMEAFVRLPEGKVMAKGFGLGLKTVHDLLQLHGSHLELESETGKGSTFSFTLPLAKN